MKESKQREKASSEKASVSCQMYSESGCSRGRLGSIVKLATHTRRIHLETELTTKNGMQKHCEKTLLYISHSQE